MNTASTTSQAARDTIKDARETVRDGISPASPTIHRGVDAPEAGRRDQQLAALHTSVHGASIGELDRHRAPNLRICAAATEYAGSSTSPG